MAVDSAALSRLTGHLLALRAAEPLSKRDIIRVSSAGECSRKIGYKLLGFAAPPPTVPETITFQIGHAYHAMLQGWLTDMGWIEPGWTEMLLEDTAERLRGSCDGITVRLDWNGMPSPEGTRRVIEIKSITNVAQERYGKASAGAFTRLEKPRDYHLDQANLYADLWNRQLHVTGDWDLEHDRVTDVTMIYVAKDAADMPIKVFTQPVSEKRLARIGEKFRAIWRHVDREELPPRDHDPFAAFPPCSYCPFQALCVEGE